MAPFEYLPPRDARIAQAASKAFPVCPASSTGTSNVASTASLWNCVTMPLCAPMIRGHLVEASASCRIVHVNFAHRARWDLTEGRFDYLLVGSTAVSEPLPPAETRLGRRTALTLPLLPPPQKN